MKKDQRQDNNTSASRRPPRKILPAALLVEGRRCLVVGGGAVAGRKAAALLAAGAEVILVAPALGEAAADLRARGEIEVRERIFSPRDLEAGLFLVIAATDDRGLNREILAAARERGLLAACPDTGWEGGDFISPASFRHEDLTVSVSTGGSDCRRARLIKEGLARHAESLGQADLLAAGTDHRLATLAQREPLHLSGPRLAAAGGMLRQILGLHEFMLLTTCNRVELIGLAAAGPDLQNIVTRILGLDRLPGLSYFHRGREAFRHLALAVSGLLSQTPGETQIRAQVKAALELSRREGWSGGVLQDWVGRALRIARAVSRAGEGLPREPGVEDLCLSFLESELGSLAGRRILVLGSGTVGMAVMEKLAAAGAEVSCCYHSRPPVFSGTAFPGPAVFPLFDLDKLLPDQEAIVCAARSDGPLLAPRHRHLLDPDRKLVVADLGVPRNVSAGFAAGAAGLRLADLDHLKGGPDGGPNRIGEFLARGEAIISEHLGEYDRVLSGIHSRV